MTSVFFRKKTELSRIREIQGVNRLIDMNLRKNGFYTWFPLKVMMDKVLIFASVALCKSVFLSAIPLAWYFFGASGTRLDGSALSLRSLGSYIDFGDFETAW